MRQSSLTGFEKYTKKTRKEQFLEEMDRTIPWYELTQALKPCYPDPNGPGRRPKGLERMLRIYFMQHWFNLSDPGMEEALYDSRVMRGFAGIDLGEEAAPDETTILDFRHLLEAKNMGAGLLRLVNVYMAENGLKVSRGTIVDASIINAPSSTKNRDQARDPDMHQTKKGSQWYFGMKLHIGVDSKTKLVHSAVATAANVDDSQVLDHLLHGDETRVWGDSAYSGQMEALRQAAPYAQDFTQQKASRHRALSVRERSRNRTKSKVRSRGGTCIPCAEVPVWDDEGTLPGVGEERRSPVCGAGTGQSGNGEAAVIADVWVQLRLKSDVRIDSGQLK
jgi:IS5 family transposase